MVFEKYIVFHFSIEIFLEPYSFEKYVVSIESEPEYSTLLLA